ncbi:hypothetical protein HG531_001072 [Fusarium graminearum]|nr:hypothetical protein HG531_001072 [Fusarium graminearum]
MGSSRVPDDQVTGVSLNLVPLAVVLLKPLHASICESVPLWRPSGNAFLGATDIIVKFLTQQVTTLGDDKAAVIRAIGQQVDKSLKTTEAGLVGILILMRPGLVLGDDQVFGAKGLLESPNDTRLSANVPDKVFVGCTISQKHTLLVDDGKLVGVDAGAVVAVVSEITVGVSYRLIGLLCQCTYKLSSRPYMRLA